MLGEGTGQAAGGATETFTFFWWWHLCWDAYLLFAICCLWTAKCHAAWWEHALNYSAVLQTAPAARKGGREPHRHRASMVILCCRAETAGTITSCHHLAAGPNGWPLHRCRQLARSSRSCGRRGIVLRGWDHANPVIMYCPLIMTLRRSVRVFENKFKKCQCSSYSKA